MKKLTLLLFVLVGFWGEPSAYAQCLTYTNLPISATADGQTIRDKHIFVTGSNGINVNGFKNVKIRHCKIEYRPKYRGIKFSNAPNLTIDSCEIIMTNGPSSGPLASYLTSGMTMSKLDSFSNSICIDGYNSPKPIITKIKMSNGTAGIYLDRCDTATIQYATGFNFRGVKVDSSVAFTVNPRGQFIQFNGCKGGTVQDFYNYNDLNTSYTEDNINCYQSFGQVISNGIIDGNNAPSGDGIICEAQNVSGGATTGYGGSVTNVDLLNMGNGACAAIHSQNITYTNIFVRQGHCNSVGGRGVPTSGGLEFWGGSGADISTNLKLISCKIKTPSCYPYSHYDPTSPSTVWTQTYLTLVASNTNRTIYQNNFTWTDCSIASPQIINNGIVKLEKEELNTNQIIYPNPASSTIRFAGLNDEEYQIAIKDIQGVERIRQTINLDKEISIKILPEGIYFVEFMQNGQFISQKKLIKTSEK